jgi:hypothetical protein
VSVIIEKEGVVMKDERLLFLFPVIIALFLVSACATTAKMNVWKDQTYEGPVKKVLVMGLSQKKGIRLFFENEFVRQLRERGSDAVAGNTILPYEQPMDKDFIVTKAKESGADTVLVARSLGREMQRTYVPGQAYGVPGYYSRWGSYYGNAYSPGYVVEDEYVYVETNLYDIATEKLIWSAQSATIIIADDYDLIRSFIKNMIDKLSSDKLVK